MSENQQVEQNGIIYLINEEEKTANIINYKSCDRIVFIPTSIKHKSSEYCIISINKRAFDDSYLATIEFSKESKLRIIEDHAFSRKSN